MLPVAAKVNVQLLLHLSDTLTYAITLSSQKKARVSAESGVHHVPERGRLMMNTAECRLQAC